MKAEKTPSAARSSLVTGAAMLAAAAVVSKLLGTMQKIPLQNLAGDGVFGIYNAVYPLYITILTLATAGIPIAVSKFVAEHAAFGRMDEARRVLRLATAVLMATGIVCFAALYGGAGHLAGWMGVARTETAIRSVAFALLLVPPLAALRGYFQGLQDMLPTAVSQVAEQLVRVAAMIALLLYFLHVGASDAWIAAGATFGSVAGAAAGLAVMLGFWRRAARRQRLGGPGRSSTAEPAGTDAASPAPASPATTAPGAPAAAAEAAAAAELPPAAGLAPAAPPREPAAALIGRFLRYALPICLGSLVVPLLTLVDTFTMPRLLLARGAGEAEAIRAFGLYNHGLPLVQLVSMVASSLSAALIPAIADAWQRRDDAALQTRAGLAIRFSWLIGLAASCGLAAAAVPLNVMFFASAEGSGAMAVLAFTALFSTLHIVTSSVLQGLGAVLRPVRNLGIGVAIKLVGNMLLMPLWGIEGAAAAAVLAYAVASGLNLLDLRRHGGLRLALDLHGLLRPLGAVALMSAAVLAVVYGGRGLLGLLSAGLPSRLEETGLALTAVAAGAVSYLLALLRLGAVGERELDLLPGIGRKLKPLAARQGGRSNGGE
ncbi:hypothetical protein J31TS4_46290 [Paenibacillus sp. J31TS4]|uniref:putative polysaccharide biosynthesis protein n=1 Tax=Paenibacillus sp. J31TS4 TaxID=2807195 RepID=UPI001B18EE26|nr:polysaccharide biosynthesis protein [Paenibacillus sp. J31TS4]GIP41349.1 hypothetical protein J31TS4_46290 [Paenibacillus sp. J31TS4]